MTDDGIVLSIAGQQFMGWKKVDVEVGLTAFTGAFRVELTDRWAGQPDRWQIDAGSACQLFEGGDLIMTAYIDQAEYDLTDTTRRIEISGRDKTGDLVDCSAVNKPGSWTNRKLEQIAGELTKPFGIKVTAVASTGAAFPKFALEQGETVFAAIQRMCQARGVLPVTTPTGDVEIRNPGDKRAGYSLVLGQNLKSFKFRNSVEQRYSDYTVKGYATHKARGKGPHPSAAATDPGVTRNRPLVLVYDDQSTAAVVKQRALWEASVRAAKAQQATGTVADWRTPDGELYQFDRVVPVQAASQGVDDDLLVGSVHYIVDEKGKRTELCLAPPAAFTLEPLAPPKGVTKGHGAKPLTGKFRGSGRVGA